MEIKPEVETLAKIKVLGIGGGGGSTINQMIRANVKGVEFIAINTDVQALQHNLAPIKIHIGKEITRGLGAGMDPEMGRKAAEEGQNEIKEALKNSDMVFIACGLGGGTGTGASPIVANIAKELGALTIAVVTKPFTFEGTQRKLIADKGHENIINKVDTIITIPNDRILQIIDKQTSLLNAYSVVDDVLRQGVQGIAELVTVHGMTNVDFADVRQVMQNSGSAIMGIGIGKGENRAVEAAKAAIECPLLETSIVGATGVLFTITGNRDLGMFELTDAAKVITEQIAPDAKIIYGTVIDDDMSDEVKVTVVATGFGDRHNIPKSTPRINVGSIPPVQPKYQQSQPSFPSNISKPYGFSSPEKDSSMPSSSPVSTSHISSNGGHQELLASSQQQSNHADLMDDSDLEIPAFIRKKML